MNIGFVGLGFVGNAVQQAFKDYYNTESFDLIESKRTVDSLQTLAKKCNIIFLAVPTPINENGSCNLSSIYNILDSFNKLHYNNIVVIKSSVPPGTTTKLTEKYKNIQIVFNPEFLTERNAEQDFKNQTRIILGGPLEAVNAVAETYETVFQHVPIFKTDCTTAEMVKFVINCFLATKISFFNEIYQVTQKLNVNYNEMIKLSLLDNRIGESHTQVPGWDGNLGFGGSCFPANINILINEVIKLGIDPKVLQAVWDKNLEVRPGKDWELLEGRCVVKK